MPHPRISSQPVFLHTLHPFPPQIRHAMSTSALGSVNGKKLGLNLTPTPSPKTSLTNSVSTPFRSPKVTPSSTRSPSIWWNIGVWDISLSHPDVPPDRGRSEEH